MSHRTGQNRHWLTDRAESIRLAFAEFLALPTCIILGFLALSAGTHLLDLAKPGWLAPLRALLHAHVFANPAGTSSLLSTVAAGLVTLTSLTIPLLLLALQLSAANMTAQILDQFLRRRINQAYFGFFVGAALYSLVILSTVNKAFNPIFGAALALLLTTIALYMLIILLYTTIDQMRPVQIMEAIHDHVLAARKRQRALIRRTRREPRCDGSTTVLIKADEEGFVTRINIDAVGNAAQHHLDEVEIDLQVEIGTYVAFQDTIATVKTHASQDVTALTKITHAAVVLERQRDITADPGYGVDELATIGWAAISSAKSSLGPGLLAILSLRDVLAHWSAERISHENSSIDNEDGGDESALWPIVYRDRTFDRLLDAFESLAVISSESMQYQAFAEVLRTFAIMYPRMPAEHQPRVENLLLRILPALGDHVLTGELDSALSATVHMLKFHRCLETASHIEKAQSELRQSVGRLNSRSTRVPG